MWLTELHEREGYSGVPLVCAAERRVTGNEAKLPTPARYMSSEPLEVGDERA